MIPENLKHAMKDYKHKENEMVYVGTAMLDAGRPLYRWEGHVYCSGGGGYTFNRFGLRKLVGILPTCWPDAEVPTEDQVGTLSAPSAWHDAAARQDGHWVH